MKSFQELAEDYIKYQQRLYKRNLQSYTRSYIKGFAKFIEEKSNTFATLAPTPLSNTPKTTENIQTAGIKKIAVITEEIGSMTGGRYYAWFIACGLVELGYDVTLYTNQTPTYIDYFKDYKQPKLQLIQPKSDLDKLDIQADIYISSPLLGNVAVTKLSDKYRKPCFVMVFDPLPMMKEYTTPYSGWEESIGRIRRTNVNLITLCEATTPYTYEWLNKRKDQVFTIYPCINSVELAKAEKGEREDYVVFISRLVRHKKFEDVMNAVKKAGVKLKVISSVRGAAQTNLIKHMKMEDDVEFLIGVDDKKKFEVINKSSAIINGSIFEGFGMWAAEGVATGTPVVAYKIPPIEEIERISGVDNFYLAEFNNSDDLTAKLQQALEEKKFREGKDTFNFSSMTKRLNQIFRYEPRIGVVTIALNEGEFIKASLRAISKHPNIEKIAVVEGAVNLFSHACGKDGLSKDNTKEEVLEAIRDNLYGNKIIYEQYGWARDKSELRNRALQLLNNVDYILVVDADEVWSLDNLNQLVKTIKDNHQADIIRFQFLHFWKNLHQVATGGQWNSMLFRCFKYVDKTLHWKSHETAVVDGEERLLSDYGTTIVSENTFVHHLGYVKNEKNVLDKLEYYKKRDTHLQVKDTFTNWKKGKPTSPTHPGGTTKDWNGILPQEIVELPSYNLIK